MENAKTAKWGIALRPQELGYMDSDGLVASNIIVGETQNDVAEKLKSLTGPWYNSERVEDIHELTFALRDEIEKHGADQHYSVRLCYHDWITPGKNRRVVASRVYLGLFSEPEGAYHTIDRGERS